MIDWTDRSEDVLARFEAWREWVKTQIGVDITDDLADITEAEYILMQDLATMVRELADTLADATSQISGETMLINDAIRLAMCSATDPETGERLFPDPRS